ncbi:MAG: peptidoglycan DD-metalloendopeptidase family protein [Pseudomonadota bacterium]|nr:peptidoglycan DD-metalloendopeptidase family protein [Pseudomonadota bacterium]
MTSVRSRFPAGTSAPSFGLAAAVVLLACACSTRQPAPVEERGVQPPSYRRGAAPPPAPRSSPAVTAEAESHRDTYSVKRGDTLYLIALDHGLDYRELAAWNNVENVNLIRVGQTLRLTAPGETSSASTASSAGTTAGGVTTAPLRSVAPIVASDGKPPPTPPATSGHTNAPAGEKTSTAVAAPVPPPAPAVSRNTQNYKTQPKAAKEPYSERALREMQQRYAGNEVLAGAGSGASSAGATSAQSGAGHAPASAAAPSPAPAASSAPAAAAPADGAPAAAPSPPVVARADPKLESRSAPAGEEDDDKLEWVWPTTGKLVTGFSDTANLKGIDIAGKTGQPVLASAAGKVVYAGTGLRGYGKLIIVKHSKNYLTAYAHNKEILVKEGQQVTRAQKIAEMGNTDADQVKLHFEIRRLGKPMDPLKYLPPP